jgi:hypothetical protein
VSAMLDAALRYAALGWAVFPVHGVVDGRCACNRKRCTSPAKHPVTKNGFKDATEDEDQIRRWWTQRPNANVAVATGSCSGLWVLDVDVKHDGVANWARLRADRSLEGAEQRTGSGGSHLLFAWDSNLDVRNRTAVLPGIDVRGTDGYAIVAPSLHVSGQRYEWLRDPTEHPPQLAPTWLLELVCGEATHTVESRTTEDAASPPTELRVESIKSALSALDADCDREQWIRVGMALHSTRAGETAFGLWNAWSATGTAKYPGEPELRRQWSSFKSSKSKRVALATVFHLAKEHGWSESATDDDPSTAEGKGKPEVHIHAGYLPQAAEKTEALLNKRTDAPPTIYQRQGSLVRTVRLEEATGGRVSIESGATVIRQVDEAFILDQAARVARFVRYDKKGNAYFAHPPAELAQAVLSHAGAWVFPRLVGVVEAPQLFADGRLLEREGFDDASGLLVTFRGVKFPPIASSPSKEVGQQALDWLDAQLLAGFPFVDDCDRSAALSQLLTAVGRSACGQAPAFGATAPNRSCGKSTLLRLASLLATGRNPAVISPGASEEESDKRILSLLQDGLRCICFDNLASADALDTAAVAKALTESVYTGRPLGKTGTLSLSTEGVLWTFAGVGIAPRGDIVSRCVMIRLDPGIERPWARRWETPNPAKVALKKRGDLVAAGLTALRAFIAAGRPAHGLEPHRLTDWDELIRAALLWYGRADPLAGLAQLEAEDPEAEALADLMEGWWAVLRGTPTTVADALRAASAHDQFRSAVRVVASSTRTDDVAGADPKRLGRYLAKHERRVIGGRRFVRLGTSGTRVRWALQTAEEPSVGAVRAVSAVTPLSPTRDRTAAHAHAHGPGQGESDCANCADCESIDAQTGEVIANQPAQREGGES